VDKGFEIFGTDNVLGVAFSKYKEFGIGNLSKWLEVEEVLLNPEMKVLDACLKLYHRDAAGKPIKKYDHAPDALMCAFLHFLFTEEHDDPTDDIIASQSLLL